MKYITAALAKGRLAQTAAELFQKIGFDTSELMGKSRKLIFADEKNMFRFILVKASDVPTYVEYGAADIGIVGRDTLLEEGRSLYEMLDLGFGKCRMCVAGPPELHGRLMEMNNLRVATKYPEIAKEYFNSQNRKIELIRLGGSVELAPLVGLSDVIVDIVESGKTLAENGLCVLEDICCLSARLVVNRVSVKTERERIMEVVDKLKKLLEENDDNISGD